LLKLFISVWCFYIIATVSLLTLIKEDIKLKIHVKDLFKIKNKFNYDEDVLCGS